MEQSGMKFLVIVNPQSGSGRSKKYLQELQEIPSSIATLLSEQNLESPKTWPVIWTTQDGSWKKDVRELLLRKGEFSGVAAIGGDGTLAETVALIYETKSDAALFAVPGGRGNDFVRGLLGYSKRKGNFWEWSALQGKWAKKPLDLGQSGDRVFLNMASVGYGGRVVENAQSRRAFWSQSPFVYQVEGILGMFEPDTGTCLIEVDGKKVYDGKFFGAFVGNGPANGNGLFWTPDASFFDQRLDVIAFERPHMVEAAVSLRRIKKKERPTFSHEMSQGKTITMKFDRHTALELDGDFVSNAMSHSFKCLAGAIKAWVLE